MKFVCEIPARLGSKRVYRKNLRPICGKPMIAYAIDACQRASLVDEVYVNTESDLIAEVAESYGARVYRRPAELALDEVVSDQFNYDFLKNVECDALVMVNPVSPLVESIDVDEAIRYYQKHSVDSLISVRNQQLHAFFREKPINFSTESLLPMTQDIEPVQVCVWTVCIWNREVFLKSFERNGYAVFSGKLAFYPVDPAKSLKVSYESEFRMAEELIHARTRVR
jgi:CMP-N-acetylneuraminic acid synthetase